MTFNNIREYCGNDLTSVYKIESKTQFNIAESNEYVNNNLDKYYLFHRLISFGDYDNSCNVERSNVRVFMERFGSNKFVVKMTGIYGYEAVAIRLDCDDEDIIDTLCALDEYPCMDDEDAGAIIIEMEQECWESYIKQDLKYAIEKKFSAYGSDMDEDKLFSFYKELCEKSNQHFEVEAGGNGYINIKMLVDYVEEPQDWMKLEL